MLAAAAVGCGAEPTLVGISREVPLDVSAVSLPEVTAPSDRAGGRIEDGRLTMVAGEGRLLLVYFGYLNCPDICPTTLADLRLARSRIDPERAARLDLAFVTVDPGRDTPEALGAYLTHFADRWHAVRADGPDLARALDAFLASAEVRTAADGEVEVTHTAVLYAVDDAGHVVVEWPFGTSGAAIAADLDVLFDRMEG